MCRCCSSRTSSSAATCGASPGAPSRCGWGSATCTPRSRPPRWRRSAPSPGCGGLGEPLGVAEVRGALEEGRARDDVTTRLLGAAAGRAATAAFLAEGRFVVAGLPLVGRVYAELDRAACLEPIAREGAWVEPGVVLARVRATAATLLAGERVALNFLQRLSGVATLTRRAVEAVAGTAARITHTRKTTPGLRALERYAVTVGGGVANRGSLAEAVLWKAT